MLDRTRAMLRLGVEQGRPVTTGDRRAPMWVYRRDRRPCRRCGTTIVTGRLGERGRERTTYWCPRCQPADTEPGPRHEPGERDTHDGRWK